MKVESPFISFVDLLTGVLFILLLTIVVFVLLPHFRNQDIVSQRANVRAVVQAGNLPDLRFSLASNTLFAPNTAKLLPDGRSQILAKMQAVQSIILARSANQITISGSSSPTYRSPALAAINPDDAQDSNLDLSVLRSLAVAHYLESIGVPYRCLVVQGFGINRSKLPEGKEFGLQWKSQSELRAMEEMYASERSVDIYIDKTASSCSTEALQSGVRNGLMKEYSATAGLHVRAAQVEASNHPQSPWLGIYYRNILSGELDTLQLSTQFGVVILQVDSSSPASAVGLMPGDVLLKFNSQIVANENSMPPLVAQTKVGQTVLLNVSRAGKLLGLSVVMANKRSAR